MSTMLTSVAPGGDWLQTSNGRPFFAVIVNYVGHSDRAWSQFMPGRFDPELIEADFRLARLLGANVIRTFVASPLQNEFPKGDWSKLDGLVAAAEHADLRLLLTLSDYGPTYLQTMAAHAGQIAAHYRGNPAILGYDLRNEPRFYNLAILHYPKPIPLLSAELTTVYPPRRSSADALKWARSEGRVPAWVADADAIRYANAYTVWSEFLAAASIWSHTRNLSATMIEFMRSAEAEPWQPLLQALNNTLAAWLAPQVKAIRAADPDRLVTVGWNDPCLASLPANAILDFLSMHRYPPNAPRWLDYHIRMASGLRSVFPGKPVLLTEFGFPTSEIDPAQAAVCESAVWLQCLEHGLAGAGKWMLWDLPPGPNPRERSFGLYTHSGEPKPVAYALPALSELLAASATPRGDITLSANRDGGVAYEYHADDARCFGGEGTAGDELISWQGQGVGQLFSQWPTPGLLRVRATAHGRVILDLGRLRRAPDLGPYTLSAGGAPVDHVVEHTRLIFAIAAGQTIECRYATVGETAGVDAIIAIVWPHHGLPVIQAQRANITAYLLQAGSRLAVSCDFSRDVTLWQALDNEPAYPVAAGVRRLAEFGGRRVPVCDFNDVDVSAARDPGSKLYFSVRVAGSASRANVWVHGADARTLMPQPYQAEAELSVSAANAPAEVDARIQILWPHGGAPISHASRGNLTADLFLPGTRKRLAPADSGLSWRPAVWLVRAIDNGVGERVALGALRVESNGVAHWDFNNVDISAARKATSKVHFWLELDGIQTHTNFWTHGLDARTYLPDPEPPLGDCA